MKQITKRFVSMIVSLILLVGALILYFDFIAPAYRDSQEVKAEELSRQAFIDTQRAAVKQVQNLISAYQGQGELREAVSLALPLHEDFAGILAELDGVARASNLAPQAFSAAAGSAQPLGRVSTSTRSLEGGKQEVSPGARLRRPINTLTFTVKFAGTYEDLKSFLEKLETNIRIFDVRSLNIQAAAKATQDLLTYDITIATYYQNP